MSLSSLFNLLETSNAPVGSEIADTIDVLSTVYYAVRGRELPEGLKLRRYRTTSQILWSCLATIFLCTWSAIRPNLSGPRDSGFQRFTRQIVTMFCAIIAPELIAYWAIRQRIAARGIKKKFNADFNGGFDPELSIIMKIKQWFTGPKETPRRGWTCAHGFFVQMGGFVLYDNGKPQKVLTFERMLESIRNNEINVLSLLSIQEEDITGNGKSDFLTKSLLVAQTTWFIAQCTARWRLGLPLAGLEVLTLAFVALNAIIYIIWWDKPQGVQVPIKIPLKSTRYQRTSPNPLCNTPGAEPKQSTPDLIIYSERSTLEATGEAETMPETVNASRVSRGEELCNEESHHAFLNIRDILEEALRFIRTRQDIGSSCCAIIFFSVFVAPVLFVSGLTSLLEKQCFSPQDREHITATASRIRVPMCYVEDRGLNLRVPDLSVAIWFVFGALHLTLWSSSSFPTPLEHQWWRWCSLLITVQPSLTFIPFLMVHPDVEKDTQDYVRYILVSSSIFYIFARCSLICLSFSALSRLPKGVYRDVQWAHLVPHIQ